MALGPLKKVTDYRSIAGCCGVGNLSEVLWASAVKNNYPLDLIIYFNRYGD
jgi:hypothetical protein